MQMVLCGPLNPWPPASGRVASVHVRVGRRPKFRHAIRNSQYKSTVLGASDQMGLRRRKCRGDAPGASRRHVSLECVTTSARRATGVWRRPRAARSAARPWPQRTPCAANGPCRACSPGVSARFPRWPWSCRRGRAARRRPRAAGHGRGRQGACGSDARVRVVLRRHLRERELGFGGHCGGRKIPSVGLGPRGLTPPTLPGLLRR